jgi:hypothetical protein
MLKLKRLLLGLKVHQDNARDLEHELTQRFGDRLRLRWSLTDRGFELLVAVANFAGIEQMQTLTMQQAQTLNTWLSDLLGEEGLEGQR